MQIGYHDDNKDSTPVYSSKNTTHDYLTLKGIELRTQIKGNELYTAILGEMLDNAIDYMETHNVKDPEVQVNISTTSNVGIPLVCMVVRNSVSPGSRHVFSKQHLDLIYNYSTYYSSKGFYKISRGALGDASKLMLGAAYTLADSMDIDLREAGIIPITQKTCTNGILKTFHIGLSSDAKHRITEEEERRVSSNENYTEIQILLPYDVDADIHKIEWELSYYIRGYALPNAHIKFAFKLPSSDISDRSLHFPATQSMINSDKNLSDIHFYNLSEFRQATKEIHDRKQIIYDVLLKNFRNANNLPKNDLTLARIEDLETFPGKIEELFELMREKIPEISRERGFAQMIPYSTNKKERRMALEERLMQYGISCDRVKYKQEYGFHRSDGFIKSKGNDGTEYPFFFEVFVGHSKDLRTNLKVVQTINSKLSNDYMVFGGPYTYETDSTKYIYSAHSILDIFEHFKYSYDEKKCKKPSSIILVNLISPRINYKSHGKSRIDHTPFAKVIADTIVKACKGGDDKNGKVDQIVGLREVLKDRRTEFLAIRDPIERKKREWTQSDVFYATRKLLINDYGYTDQEINRDHLTSSIREECEKLGITREEIGIIAADRAQLYYNGKWSNVVLDEIETQVDYGTDMVIIEKEGVVIQISLFSNSKRIALLNTRGFLVEYASKLAKLANEKGCNISIIVDWDVSGLLIYLKVKKIVPAIKRIGVDFETLRDLGLMPEDVQEKYDATKNKHFSSLKNELEEALDRARAGGSEEDIEELEYLQENLSYLARNRIEINSVTVQLNDNARFWNWVEDELRFWFKHRDFTRSADVLEYVEPDALHELNDVVKQKSIDALRPQREVLLDKLANNDIENAFLLDRTNKIKPGFDYDDYNKAIGEQSKKIEENNPQVKPYLEGIGNLLNDLKNEGKDKTAEENRGSRK